MPHQKLHDFIFCRRQPHRLTIHEKLFLLEGMMNTETGKAIARKRTQYMQEFVDEFLSEWDGLDK